MTDKLHELSITIERLIETKRGELKALETKIRAAEENLRELTERLEGMPEKVVEYEKLRARVKAFVDNCDEIQKRYGWQ